uniref:Natural killer cells antigen CD94-like n=1 Tax=Geotrypetes seraphini TaxID=260995 RepID=A0A6P8S7B4_GEOSA|nr:natural killer cells antigen CD94-like [Geotrypetes seraphini]
MAETVTYSDLRIIKKKTPTSFQSRSPGSSGLQKDREVTYAAIRVPETEEEKIYLEPPRTEAKQKALLRRRETCLGFYASLFLLILCVVLLIVSITLGVLYQTSLKNASTPTGLDLLEKLEKLKIWETMSGQQYEFCPESWRPWKGKCYFLSNEKKIWRDGQEYCVSRDSHLALLETLTDLDFMPNSTNDVYWIGVRNINNTWQWHNGTKPRSSVKVHHNSSCAVLSVRGLLDWNCLYLNYWICEKSTVRLQFDPHRKLPLVSVNGMKHIDITNKEGQT